MGLGRWAVDAIDAGLDARAHVLDAIDLGASARDGLGRARWGLGGLVRESGAVVGRHAGVPTMIAGTVAVGNGMYHGDEDRRLAIDLLSAGFDAFAADMLAAVTSAPDDLALAQWWAITVHPAIEEWRRFADKERSSYVARFATSWEAFEAWRDRLVRMRENARVHGIALASPEPARLPQTYTEQGSRGTAGPIATLWTAIKVFLYAVIGFTGLLGLWHVYRDLRYGRHTLREATIGRLTS